MTTYLLPLRQHAALFLAMLAAATALALTHFGATPRGVAACVLLYTLVALALIDARAQLLPDVLTLPLIGLGVALSAFGVTGTPLLDSLDGAVVGYGALWIVNTLYRLTRRKEGMGYGDFKLLAGLGAWLGWQMLPLVLVIGAGVGALVVGGLIAVGRHDRQAPFAFGPFLVLAGVVVIFHGTQLAHLVGAP